MLPFAITHSAPFTWPSDEESRPWLEPWLHVKHHVHAYVVTGAAVHELREDRVVLDAGHLHAPACPSFICRPYRMHQAAFSRLLTHRQQCEHASRVPMQPPG